MTGKDQQISASPEPIYELVEAPEPQSVGAIPIEGRGRTVSGGSGRDGGIRQGANYMFDSTVPVAATIPKSASPFVPIETELRSVHSPLRMFKTNTKSVYFETQL